MALILNRMGYRLGKVVKARPQKRIPETDAIFENINEKEQLPGTEGIKRVSMDCKATVNIGDYSRGGKTRGDNRACDHDMGCDEKYVPCGIVDEDTGKLNITFGSSYKPATSLSIPSVHGGTDSVPGSARTRFSFISKWTTVPRATGCALSFSSGWGSLSTPSVEPSSCSTIPLTTAGTIPLRGVGACWNAIGMEPGSRVPKRCSNGPKR